MSASQCLYWQRQLVNAQRLVTKRRMHFNCSGSSSSGNGTAINRHCLPRYGSSVQSYSTAADSKRNIPLVSATTHRGSISVLLPARDYHVTISTFNDDKDNKDNNVNDGGDSVSETQQVVDAAKDIETSTKESAEVTANIADTISETSAPDPAAKPDATKDMDHAAKVAADIAKHKAGLSDPDVPAYQNPLHHNNPDMQRMEREDFDSEEEFLAAVVPLPPFDGAPPDHIKKFGEEILHLSMLEMNELTNKIADHFGFHEGMLSPDGDLGDDGADDDGETEAAAAPEEKTTFDLKLISYDDKSKIKVIKEVRSIASLGLKEAKEMVEGAPKIITKDLKKENAEELKAKLEAVGAVVEIV